MNTTNLVTAYIGNIMINITGSITCIMSSILYNDKEKYSLFINIIYGNNIILSNIISNSKDRHYLFIVSDAFQVNMIILINLTKYNRETTIVVSLFL